MPEGRQIVTALIVGCLITQLDLSLLVVFAFQRNHEGASVLHGVPTLSQRAGSLKNENMGAEEAEKIQFHIGCPFIKLCAPLRGSAICRYIGTDM